MSCNLDELIIQLNNASLENKTEATVPVLEEILALESNAFENTDFTPYLLKLLELNNPDITVNASRFIADFTKVDIQRKILTNSEIISYLIDSLNSNENQTNIELLIQSCRALGNICYLNDTARDIITKINGTVVLIDLLKIPIACDNEKESQFAKVRCGLISNYLLGRENIAKTAMELNLIDRIKKIIEESLDDVPKKEELLINILPPLSILTENVSDLQFDNDLNCYLAKVLARSTNPDLAEMCLELLHYQAERDDVKLLLAKEGLCETLYELLEKYKTLACSNEARALMKLACELIVLILTGDESMEYLYTTSLLKYMENWLESSDVDLLTTGVMAIGNFARTDQHCIYIVESNIMKRLLEILSKNNGVDDDMKLQHALLSVFKNLVIPKPNKSAVIEAGLVQTILPMLEIHQPPVVFKLLGTLRMTVDDQEKLALELLRNKTLINQLVQWTKSSDYLGVIGVTGESFRLMAWLIKNAYRLKDSTIPDDTSLSEFVKCEGSIESMVNMLSSQHLVMQNEALIALSIISTILNDKNELKLDQNLIDCKIGERLSEFIIKNSDHMSKEIVENLQTFMTILRINENLVTHLAEYNIDELLKSIPILKEYCVL